MKESKNDIKIKTPMELGELLGIPEHKVIQKEMKFELFISIRRFVRKNRWTETQIIKKTKATKKVVRAIMSGDITETSTEQLISVAHNLGLKVTLKVA